MKINETIDKVISEIVFYYRQKIEKVDPEDYSEISRLSCEMAEEISTVRYIENYAELEEIIYSLNCPLSSELIEEIENGCYEERNQDDLEL